jgi:hypothetical protein
MKRILAADIGFTSVGMAIFEPTVDGWKVLDSKLEHIVKDWKVFDSKCLHTYKGHEGSVALDDVRRIESLTMGIVNYFIENKCHAMVCEIPHGGAQSASAQKAMAAATAMIATIRVMLACPVQWVTPNQSRAAAGWDKDAHKPPEGMKGEALRRFKQDRSKELKQTIMRNMEAKHPEIARFIQKDKEHIADACATFAHLTPEMIENLIGG